MERKDKQKKLEEKWEMLQWITTYIDENQVEWEDDSLEADMTEIEVRLAVKPAKLRPIVKTGYYVLMDGSRYDKAEMKPSLANMYENPQQESSKKEMETSLTATPPNSK